MDMRALAVTMLIATLQGGAKDPCTLLTPAEVQTLDPAGNIGAGVSTTASAALNSYACEYKWATGRNAGFFHVIVSDASKLLPGMSPETIKQKMLEQSGKGASEVPGIGKFAIFASTDPTAVVATAHVKNSILQLTFASANAGAQKDKIIALLKAAAGRL